MQGIVACLVHVQLLHVLLKLAIMCCIGSCNCIQVICLCCKLADCTRLLGKCRGEISLLQGSMLGLQGCNL